MGSFPPQCVRALDRLKHFTARIKASKLSMKLKMTRFGIQKCRFGGDGVWSKKVKYGSIIVNIEEKMVLVPDNLRSPDRLEHFTAHIKSLNVPMANSIVRSRAVVAPKARPIIAGL